MKLPKQMNKIGNTTALETGLFSLISRYPYLVNINMFEKREENLYVFIFQETEDKTKYRK